MKILDIERPSLQTNFIEMTIKDFGSRVAQIWEGLRPETRKLLVGALDSKNKPSLFAQRKFFYDAHSDLELSSLLSALDEQSAATNKKLEIRKKREIEKLADACAAVLEAQTGSAEVFIQLAERYLERNDYNGLDTLSNKLTERFSPIEIAEIARQAEQPQIRAIAFETLALMPIAQLLTILEDTAYYDIAVNALQQQAFEFGSEEARGILAEIDLLDDPRQD